MDVRNWAKLLYLFVSGYLFGCQETWGRRKEKGNWSLTFHVV